MDPVLCIRVRRVNTVLQRQPTLKKVYGVIPRYRICQNVLGLFKIPVHADVQPVKLRCKHIRRALQKHWCILHNS